MPDTRGYTSIGCENFTSGVDDFDEWIELFESAVELATNKTGDTLKDQFKKWLPLKLDKTAANIYWRISSFLTDGVQVKLPKILLREGVQKIYNHFFYSLPFCLWTAFRARQQKCIIYMHIYII